MEKNRIANIIYRSLFLGILLGCICYLANLFFFDAEFFSNGLEEYSIGAVMNLPLEQLMVYVLKCRFVQLLFLILGAIAISYRAVAGIYSVIFGIFYGMAMCNLLVQFGLKGVGYGFVCFFPHYLLYFLAIYFWGKWFCTSWEDRNLYYGDVKIIQYFLKFFVIIFFISLSFVWEIKFQKNILKIFYQYLV